MTILQEICNKMTNENTSSLQAYQHTSSRLLRYVLIKEYYLANANVRKQACTWQDTDCNPVVHPRELIMETYGRAWRPIITVRQQLFTAYVDLNRRLLFIQTFFSATQIC